MDAEAPQKKAASIAHLPENVFSILLGHSLAGREGPFPRWPSHRGPHLFDIGSRIALGHGLAGRNTTIQGFGSPRHRARPQPSRKQIHR